MWSAVGDYRAFSLGMLLSHFQRLEKAKGYPPEYQDTHAQQPGLIAWGSPKPLTLNPGGSADLQHVAQLPVSACVKLSEFQMNILKKKH